MAVDDTYCAPAKEKFALLIDTFGQLTDTSAGRHIIFAILAFS